MTKFWKKFRLNGYTVKLYNDDLGCDPRAEFGPIARMYCEHRNYNLGDHAYFKKNDPPWREYQYDANDNECDAGEQINAWIKKEKPEVLSLYLYDHSGISMSCNSFGDPWDSGQVGIIYMTRGVMREVFNRKRITKATRAKAIKLMRAEVKEYDQFLTGDIHGYAIENAAGERVDSLWGLFGHDYAENEARDHVKSLPFQLTLDGMPDDDDDDCDD